MIVCAMPTLLQRRNANLIRQLYYFEAVARHKSVKRAAIEIGVSQSAISHQLSALAEQLGEKLLERAGRGIVLTAVGQQLAGRLGSAFLGLEASVEEIVGSGHQLLRLAVCTSFAPGWLLPRLRSFTERNPHINLQLRLYTGDPELSNLVADAIVTALPPSPGFKSIPILKEMLVAVRAPSDERENHREQRHRLITTSIDKTGDDWAAFCDAAKLNLAFLREGPWMQATHYVLAMDLAKRGFGIALIPDFLAREPLANRELIRFGHAQVPSGREYSLCLKQSRSQEPQLAALVRWFNAMLTQERKDAHGRPQVVKPSARVG